MVALTSLVVLDLPQNSLSGNIDGLLPSSIQDCYLTYNTSNTGIFSCTGNFPGACLVTHYGLTQTIPAGPGCTFTPPAVPASATTASSTAATTSASSNSAAPASSPPVGPIVGGVAAVLVIGAVLGFAFMRKRQGKSIIPQLGNNARRGVNLGGGPDMSKSWRSMDPPMDSNNLGPDSNTKGSSFFKFPFGAPGRTQSTKGLTSNAAPHANESFTMPRPTTPPKNPTSTYGKKGAADTMDLSSILDTDFWADREKSTREGDRTRISMYGNGAGDPVDWRSDAKAAMDYNAQSEGLGGPGPMSTRSGWGASSTQSTSRPLAHAPSVRTNMGPGLAGAISRSGSGAIDPSGNWDNPFNDFFSAATAPLPGESVSTPIASPSGGRGRRERDTGADEEERVGRQRSRSRKPRAEPEDDMRAGSPPRDAKDIGATSKRRKSVDAGGSRARSKSPGAAIGRKESKKKVSSGGDGTPERRKSRSGSETGLAGLIDEGSPVERVGSKKRTQSTDRKHKRNPSAGGDTLERTKSKGSKEKRAKSPAPAKLSEPGDVAPAYNWRETDQFY
ncbi:hypothetical protein HDU93_005418 [Gonapodya sp. JEL0774]|nr:hypothetical protein HDU93_005418 [Gonapodya sp. JEL0774]